jgi:hypothetical protein
MTQAGECLLSKSEVLTLNPSRKKRKKERRGELEGGKRKKTFRADLKHPQSLVGWGFRCAVGAAMLSHGTQHSSCDLWLLRLQPKCPQLKEKLWGGDSPGHRVLGSDGNQKCGSLPKI